ncbi:MAG TPA: hypothetical protein VN734_03465 [Acidobacteriaceae bacterium]|nr:hypothetical protein [Acidobacteriaceae bacterium]
MMRTALAWSFICAGLLLTGCAVSASTGQQCANGLAMNVSPASATADHAQTSPANQVKFQATVSPTASPGCAVPNWIMTAAPTWTNPDPRDISIDSSSDTSMNGLATCLGATNGPITLTASFTLGTNAPVTQTATLSCK